MSGKRAKREQKGAKGSPVRSEPTGGGTGGGGDPKGTRGSEAPAGAVGRRGGDARRAGADDPPVTDPGPKGDRGSKAPSPGRGRSAAKSTSRRGG